MEPPTRVPTRIPTRIKVCCIASVAEARLAVEHGAAAVGLVSAMPSGPGVIADADIAAIAATVPPGVARFLLTCRTDAAGIAAQVRAAKVDVVQLCDRLAEGAHGELRAALSNVRLVQVVHVEDERAVAEAVAVAPEVDALLLDSGRPSLAVPELGGTGRVHDWTLARRIVESVRVPVWLAGGLRAENVGAALAAVRPFGVDLCSGVRTAERLDPAKLAAFVAAVRAADREHAERGAPGRV